MARAKSGGNGRLEEALAALMQNQTVLMQNQVAFLQNQTAFLARASEMDARVAEMERINSERFARIEERFARIETLLLEHDRILQALPDAIRDKDRLQDNQPVRGALDTINLRDHCIRSALARLPAAESARG